MATFYINGIHVFGQGAGELPTAWGDVPAMLEAGGRDFDFDLDVQQGVVQLTPLWAQGTVPAPLPSVTTGGQRQMMLLRDASEPGVAFVPARARWQDTKGVDREEAIRLRYHLGPGALKASWLHSTEDLFYPRIVKFWGKAVGEEGRWYYPDHAVKPEFLPFLVEERREVKDDRVIYTATFQGGAQASHAYQMALHVVALGNAEDGPFRVGYWPGSWLPTTLAKDWRLWSFVFGESGSDTMQIRVEGANVARKPVWRLTLGDSQLQTWHTALLPRSIVSSILLENAPEGVFPRVLHVVDGQEATPDTPSAAPLVGGGFDLRFEGHVGDSPGTFGLDFGTSNTCVAVFRNNQTEIATFPSKASGAVFKQPSVLVPAEGQGYPLSVGTPWLPHVPGTGRTAPSSSLPTLLLAKEQGGSIPLVDYFVPPPGFDPAATPLGSKLHANLKWDGPNARLRTDFLTVMLLLVAAADESASGTVIQLRASFPLAFEPRKKEQFARALRDASASVKSYTGRSISCSLQCDEATVLIKSGMAKQERDPQWANWVFAFDVGGGTVDAAAALIDPKPDVQELKYVQVNAGSLLFGANFFRSRLLEELFPGRKGERQMLSRKFDYWHATKGWHKWLKAGGARPDSGVHSGQDELNKIRDALRSYQDALIEWCVRFIRGTIVDSEHVSWRIKAGPKSDETVAPRIDKKPRCHILLSGNGWHWWERDELEQLFQSRLAAGKPRLQELYFEHFEKEEVARQVVQFKDFPHGADVLSAPNGIGTHWSVAVGSGSQSKLGEPTWDEVQGDPDGLKNLMPIPKGSITRGDDFEAMLAEYRSRHEDSERRILPLIDLLIEEYFEGKRKATSND